MESGTQAWTEWVFNIYTAIGWLLIIIIGAVLGWKEKITVFRDYNDLALVFLMALAPMPLMYLFGLVGKDHQQLARWFLIIFEAVLFIWIVIRTFKDNANPLSALVALITKISLSVLFVIHFIEFVTPSGKTGSQRAQSRRTAFAILLIVAPLVFALVKNKTGIFNPKRTLASRGLSV